MKKILFSFLVLGVISGCGLQARDTEAIGQIKRIAKKTPLLCPDETLLDMSLGLMRNGTGSVSQEDLWIRVQDAHQEFLLRQAVDSGAPVRVTYDVQRFRFCWEQREATKIEIIQ